jgi:hypothetical protein
LSKKTLEGILDSGNDYLIALKGNRWRLYCQVIALTIAAAAIDTYDLTQRAHGRTERRRCQVYAVAPGSIDSDWPGVRRVIVIDRWRSPTGAAAVVTRHFYLSSRSDATAAEFAHAIRAHWGIENQLHWVKDVIQNEDDNGIAAHTAPETISLLKSWALSLFGCNGFTSIKHATIRFANKIAELYQLSST